MVAIKPTQAQGGISPNIAVSAAIDVRAGGYSSASANLRLAYLQLIKEVISKIKQVI